MGERAPTPIQRFTWFVLALDLLASLVAGVVLYAFPERTDELFAWTIKAPITATFLGAGYLGAVVALLFVFAVARQWQEARILPVMGVALTVLTALVTFWHLGQFHLREGGASAQFAGWAWVVVYVSVPLLLAVAFLRQEAAGGRLDREVVEPLLPLTRGVLLVQGVGTTVVGAGLVLAASAFDNVWPWPVPALPAGAVGAWLLTTAAGSWWALREADWRRVRLAAPGLLALVVFAAVGAARYPDAFDADEWPTWTYFVALGISSLAFAAAAYRQERRRGNTTAGDRV